VPVPEKMGSPASRKHASADNPLYLIIPKGALGPRNLPSPELVHAADATPPDTLRVSAAPCRPRKVQAAVREANHFKRDMYHVSIRIKYTAKKIQYSGRILLPLRAQHVQAE